MTAVTFILLAWVIFMGAVATYYPPNNPVSMVLCPLAFIIGIIGLLQSFKERD